MLRLGLLLWILCSVCGCPKDLELPQAQGRKCTTDEDCSAERTCGTLRLCVGGRCELAADGGPGQSLLKPCADAWTPLPPPYTDEDAGG